jgi:hypothetical protein
MDMETENCKHLKKPNRCLGINKLFRDNESFPWIGVNLYKEPDRLLEHSSGRRRSRESEIHS